jgi:DNA ligase (NAD+)
MLINKHSIEISKLKELGFAINPLNKMFFDLESSFNYAKDISFQREELNFPIDGAVIKVDDNILFEQLGVVGKTPRGWSAIKFPPKEIVTRIKEIKYQVGRTGKITPVAELEEVELQGTVVKRATLHNAAEVVNLGLVEFDSVIVRKAGDIIPEIVVVLENLRKKDAMKFSLPKLCPSCKSILVNSSTNVDLCCNNPVCYDQVKLKLAYFASRQLADINGLSEKTIEKLINEFSIKSISDLYDLPFDEIQKLEGFGLKSITNLQESIDKSRMIDDYKLISGLSIEGIGIENARIIASLIK